MTVAAGADLTPIDALCIDGGVVRLRVAGPGDRAAVVDLLGRTSDRSLYLRYFSPARVTAAADVDRMVRPPADGHLAVVAELPDRLIGVASYEQLSATSVECAVLVEDGRHGGGIGTLLLEDLARHARRAGYVRFEADALAENHVVLAVLRALGPTAVERRDRSVVHLALDLTQELRFEDAVTARELRADVASLGRVLAPHSVAVVGVGSRPESAGRQVLANIIAGGYTGQLAAVNPHHRSVLGVPCSPCVADLPGTPDLAVIAVPRDAVLDVVRQCGERGVRGVVVITAGFGETGADGLALQDRVLRSAREHDMRLIGPNCLGILDTDPLVRLNATFADLDLQPGPIALASQSGALGIAMIEAVHRRGLGVSQFVSMGNKADVSGSDLLLAWSDDPRTAVIGLYLESLGNPRRFVRVARSVTARKPVVVLKAGRSDAGARAGASHTAAALSSDVVVDAVLDRAGVVRVDDMEQLLDVTHLLATQPAPRGIRLGVVGNSGGPEILAADAAARAGLDLPPLGPATRAALLDVVPTAASCTNPVDLGATVTGGSFRRAVDILLRSGEVDAVLAVYTPTSTTDPTAVMAALARTDGPGDVPLAVVDVGGSPRLLHVEDAPPGGTRRDVPVYGFPETAAVALALGARHGRRGPTREVVPPAGIDPASARTVLAACDDGWLPPDRVAALLTAYGLTVAPQRVVHDEDGLLAAGRTLGWPVALKVTGVLHKTDVGGVRLGVADGSAAVTAYRELRAVPGVTGVLVQPMVPRGVELFLGGAQDPGVGAVVLVGAGGTLTDLLTDRAFGLAPLSTSDGERMVRSLRISRLLQGYRGSAPVPDSAVVDAVRRVAALVDDLPRVAELDLNPVVARGDGLVVVDARVRLAAPTPVGDPLSRAMSRSDRGGR